MQQKNKKYTSILYNTSIFGNDVGSVGEYFVKNTEHFYFYQVPAANNNEPSRFQIYENGELIKEEKIFLYKGKNKFIIIFLYTLYLKYFLCKYSIKNTVIIGQNLYFYLFNKLDKTLNKNKYVFWVSDYYPNKSGLMFFYHKIYDYLVSNEDNVIFLNSILKKKYKNILKNNYKGIVTFGINDRLVNRKPQNGQLGFIGTLRKDQGLDIILEAVKKDKSLKLEIIGKGDLSDYVEKFIVANNLGLRIKYLGSINKENLTKYTKKWQIGIAPYKSDKENIAYYADPSKAKLYTEHEIPIIMTDVTYYANEIRKHHAGEIIKYSVIDLLAKIKQIQSDYNSYSKGVKQLKKKYNFTKKYDKGFSFLTNINE